MEFHGNRLINSFGCGVLILDGKGRVMHVNRYAREILKGRSGWRLLDRNALLLSGDRHPFGRLAAGEKITCEE